MDNSIINTENKTVNSGNILAQFKYKSIFPFKNDQLKTLLWNGTTELSEIQSIELFAHPRSFAIVLNSKKSLFAVYTSREEIEKLGFAPFPDCDNSFSFEFNGEKFDSVYVDQTYYKLVSTWEKDTYDLDELINEWLARIFKVKQD